MRWNPVGGLRWNPSGGLRAKRLACVAGVLGAGVLAAWPYRQSAAPSPPASATAPLDLALHQPGVALQAGPPSDRSPAGELNVLDQQGHVVPIQPAAFASVSRPGLEDLGPPPELPIDFSPLIDAPPPGAFVPKARSGPGWSHQQAQPRKYKLRDGDTLPNLARRFLGSESRAAEIYDANRALLASPDLLPVGLTIAIPPKERVADLEPAARG